MPLQATQVNCVDMNLVEVVGRARSAAGLPISPPPFVSLSFSIMESLPGRRGREIRPVKRGRPAQRPTRRSRIRVIKGRSDRKGGEGWA